MKNINTYSNKKNRGLSIKTKLIIFVLSISLISIFALTTLYYFNARSTIRKQALGWLTAVAESKKLHLLSFLDGKKGRTIDFSSDGFIRDNLGTIARMGSQSHAVIRLNKHLNVNKKPLDSQIVAIAILDIKGNVVASTNERWIGKDMSEDEMFISCINKNYAETYICQSYNRPYLNVNCIYISAPLTSRQENKTMGVIINAYDIAILDEITTKRARPGESGEVLLGTKSGDNVVFLTSLRYAPDIPYSKSIPMNSFESEPMRLALKGRGGAIIAPDYRGIDVVAAYQHIPTMNWGLVAKIDKEEVFAPIARLRIVTIVMGIINTIVVVTIVVILSNSITKPIRKLVEGTRRIANGDFAFRVETKSKDEIGQLSHSFNKMTEQLKTTRDSLHERSENLQRSNIELEEFAYVVSHDLKSPLRGVSSLSEWITMDYADKIDKEGKRKLELLGMKVRRMNDLINGILEYSRIGRSAEEQIKVDFNDLIKSTVRLIEIPENIEIKVDNDLPTFVCDKVRMEQVFLNLINNAVKYIDKPKGEIRVDCVESGTYWKFNITDNGQGIEDRHFDKIFKLFQTLESRDKTESTGVGLSLVKRIISMQGGKIWVKSEVGKGSTFYFTISKVQKRKEEIGKLLVKNSIISQ